MDVENANCKWKVSQCTDMEVLPLERPLKVDREITGLQKLIEELHSVFSHDHVNVQDVQKLMCGYKSDPKDWRRYAKFDRYRYTRNLVDEGNGAFNIIILCWSAGQASSIHDHADSHCFMKVLSGNLQEIRYDWPKNVQPEVFKVLRNKQKSRRRCCSEAEDKLLSGGKDLKCQNDSCQNFGGDIEEFQNGGGENNNGVHENGNECEREGCEGEYDVRGMEELGRSTLEVNDVCYINDALGLHRVENPSHVDGAVSLHLYCPPFDACRVFDARTSKPASVNVTFWSRFGKRVVIDGEKK